MSSPKRDSEPCGEILRLTGPRVLAPLRGCDVDIADSHALRRIPELRISAEVADYCDLVERSHKRILLVKNVCVVSGGPRSPERRKGDKGTGRQGDKSKKNSCFLAPTLPVSHSPCLLVLAVANSHGAI